ncbi:MAG: acyl-CoA reductase [Chitinophagaceae bacterium]|nr:acyl-CoA reductase [Chitinophagaceae bacterium]
MNVQYRIGILEKLGNYILSENPDWLEVKYRAAAENPWFDPKFIDLASVNIALGYLQPSSLEVVLDRYEIPETQSQPKNVGIVMAGNIPLVGFHDFLCVFLSGHKQSIKPSSKDSVLIQHLANKLIEWQPELAEYIVISERLLNCDAYIATGSNNTSRYFEQYFGKYPNIIRKNRTSAAILAGDETPEQLQALADDVYQYYGLGCRNVTKLYVPADYDFVSLLEAFRKYTWLADHSKYKNNYDYQLAVLIINKLYYMTNESVLLVENKALFSPISQLHYEFYKDRNEVIKSLQTNESVQAIVGKGHFPFGSAQRPSIVDFADGTDTMKFLLEL